MQYEVYLWESIASKLPDVEAVANADDPLEATFAVMRAHGVKRAYYAWVFAGHFDGVGIAEYSEFACPDLEVC